MPAPSTTCCAGSDCSPIRRAAGRNRIAQGPCLPRCAPCSGTSCLLLDELGLTRNGAKMASQSSHTPEQLVADLVLLLDLEPKGGDRFIGRRRPDGTGRVFGGQAIAQALGAARRTVDDAREAHSLHAYFLRPGSDDLPIEYRVKRDLDGRSFSNRRVVASQDGKPILNLTASFQIPVDGPGHQAPQMPDVPGRTIWYRCRIAAQSCRQAPRRPAEAVGPASLAYRFSLGRAAQLGQSPAARTGQPCVVPHGFDPATRTFGASRDAGLYFRLPAAGNRIAAARHRHP